MEWTKQELEILSDPSLSHRDVATNTGRSYSAVKIKRRQLGIKDQKKDINEWTSNDILLLKKNIHLPDSEIAKKIGKTASSISNKRLRLQFYKDINTWDEEELDYLLDNYGTVENKEIAKFLGRPIYGIQSKASELGITRRTDYWRQYEIDILLENWDAPLARLVEQLNKSKAQISYKKAHINTLKKKSEKSDNDFIEKDISFNSLRERYFSAMVDMVPGDSFEFPVKDYHIILDLKKLFTEAVFKTKKVDQATRRIFKLL